MNKKQDTTLTPEEKKRQSRNRAMAKYMAKKRKQEKEESFKKLKEKEAELKLKEAELAARQKELKNKDKLPAPIEKGTFHLELDKKRSLDEFDFGKVLNEAMDVVQPSTVNVDEFFSFLELKKYNSDLYKGITMSKEMAEGIRNHLMSMKHGTHSAVPLLCKGGAQCPMVNQCWFAKRNEEGEILHEQSIYPLFKPCPVETSIIELKIRQYVAEHLGSNMNITPSVMNLISKLAELDIYEIRADMLLSSGTSMNGDGQNLLITVIDAIDQKNGNAYFTVKEHPALAIKEKIQNQKDKLMKSLLSTPEAKLAMAAKLKGSDEKKDSASMLTQIATALKKQASKVDSYIDVDTVNLEDL